MKKMIDKIKNDDISNINIIPIKNNFFGKNITVAGLVTGSDIID